MAEIPINTNHEREPNLLGLSPVEIRLDAEAANAAIEENPQLQSEFNQKLFETLKANKELGPAIILELNNSASDLTRADAVAQVANLCRLHKDSGEPAPPEIVSLWAAAVFKGSEESSMARDSLLFALTDHQLDPQTLTSLVMEIAHRGAAAGQQLQEVGLEADPPIE